jgi:D-alanyl-D-alanine carboxypeptidase (penicillin-binding protein 5/6)
MNKFYACCFFLCLISLCAINYGESSLSYEKVIPKITSGFGIVTDVKTGRILYEKNANVTHSIASTTKIMTAILAIEKGRLDDVVTVSKRAAQVSGSNAGLIQDEKITLGELLYCLMIPSGNDAAIAIAEHIGGSVEKFAQIMNQKAKEIGAMNTNYITPHGLDREGQYSTAYDLALITQYAFKNKLFCEIVATRSRTAYSVDGKIMHHLYTTNELLDSYPGADGVKTGYTGKAGRCLVGSATRNNWRVISVVLGSNTRSQRASDSTKMLNYAFENYQMKDLNELNKVDAHIAVKKGIEEELEVKSDEPVHFPIREDEEETVSLRYDLPQYIIAPIQKGQKLGTATYSIGAHDCKQVDLFAPKTIRKKEVGDFFGDLFKGWVKTNRFELRKMMN